MARHEAAGSAPSGHEHPELTAPGEGRRGHASMVRVVPVLHEHGLPRHQASPRPRALGLGLTTVERAPSWPVVI